MKLISHRGNLIGKNSNFENKPFYILNAIKKGFDVEVDVWFVKSNFYLGHDFPEIKIDFKFLKNKKIWCHAKNADAIPKLAEIKAHYFWHQEDDYTITSKGFLWVYPGKKLIKNSICVQPKKISLFSKNCIGICSDKIELFKKIYD